LDVLELVEHSGESKAFENLHTSQEGQLSLCLKLKVTAKSGIVDMSMVEALWENGSK
jgi:hypothetical protein